MARIREVEWVKSLVNGLQADLMKWDKNVRISDQKKIVYANEVLAYKDDIPQVCGNTNFQTDLLVFELIEGKKWIPRVVIEVKLKSMTTHDTITYSQKALMHKQVHPYLRYGALVSNRQHHPIPGRWIRHGQQFDFIITWTGLKPDDNEWNAFLDIIKSEYKSSQTMEEVIYNSRKSKRKKYSVYQRSINLV